MRVKKIGGIKNLAAQMKFHLCEQNKGNFLNEKKIGGQKKVGGYGIKLGQHFSRICSGGFAALYPKKKQQFYIKKVKIMIINTILCR